MEKLNKDSHHTRTRDLVAALTTAFALEKRGDTSILSQFSENAFQYPHGHPRYARGSSMRAAMTGGGPISLSNESAQAIANVLSTKNMYALMNDILASTEHRTLLVQTFEDAAIRSLSNDQLSLLSPTLLRDMYMSLPTPEERASRVVIALGKEQTLDGLRGLGALEKNIDALGKE